MEVVLPSRWDSKFIEDLQWLAARLYKSVKIRCEGNKILIKGEIEEVEMILNLLDKKGGMRHGKRMGLYCTENA